MLKNKLSFIISRYSLDKKYFALIIIFLWLSAFFAFGIYESLYYIIPTIIFISIVIYMIIDIISTYHRISRNEVTILPLNNCKAYVKQTKENKRIGSILIKIYIIDDNNKKYNYYFLNGSEVKFKNYVNMVNQGKDVKIAIYKKTNIISFIEVDNEKLEDLYVEVKTSKKMRNPIIYNHLNFKRTKKAIYGYMEYTIDDVQIVFENAKLYEELYIINRENRYVKISYNQETHKEFYIENKKFDSFLKLKEELDETKFIFDNKLRVIYTFGNTDPASFIMFVNEVK